jgi:hypothetical protein
MGGALKSPMNKKKTKSPIDKKNKLKILKNR